MARVLAALILSMWVALSAHAQRVSTFAGGGVGEQSPALNALLINPSHLAVDRFNNLHVTDRGGHRILKITPAGVISTVVGTGFPGRLDQPGGYHPITEIKVNSPSGIAFRPTPFNFDPTVDELVFADTGNHWLAAVDTVTATEPVAYKEFGGLQGYCCDDFNVFADFDTPQGLAVDAAGNVYIADTNNHLVRRLNWHNYFTSPTIDRIAGMPQQAGSTGDGFAALFAKLQNPRAVALDAAGDLYIAESHRIRKVNMATGVISTLVGATTAGYNGDGPANASLLLDTPTDLKFGPDGNLYFVDSGNYRVRRIVAGAVQTVAGTGATSDSGDGLAATSAGLAGPRGIVFNADGHLFVTMYNSGKIRRIAAGTGVITTYVGGAVVQPNGGYFAGDGGLARGVGMNSPGGATPLSDGSFYLADAFNHRVRLVNGPNGSGPVSTIAGNGTPGSSGDSLAATSATINTPVSVAIDASGNRYIAERNGGRVRKVTPGGTITTFAGGGVSSPGDGGAATSALLVAPSWVVARGADVYIADSGGNRIVKVTAGILTTVAGGGASSPGDGGPATAATLNSPTSFVFDAAGNLLIAEAGGNRVRKVTTGGTISTVAGTGTPGFAGDGGLATAAQLNFPMGISVDDAGALYIVDRDSHRIRKVLPNGTIKTMGGDGTPGFSGDGGDSPNARFNLPSFITRDTAGRLYVADTDNHRVRRINPRVPFPPTLGTLTPGVASISIAFSPPADDGNSVIIEYIAECNGPNAGNAIGASSPLVVTGLTNGATYTCVVFARNAVDWGELSATSAPVTVGLAPTITSAAPPTSGTIGSAYSHTYTAIGAPAPTYTVDSGALPPGLTLSPAGVISGSPTASGPYSGTVLATNGFAPNATQTFSITVAKAGTTVTLTSNANPSTVGGPVTFTAALTGSSPAPTGTLAFKDGGATISGCGAVAIASSEAACTTSSLPIGTRSITAEYSGNADYNVATSNTVNQTIAKASTTVSLVSGANPSIVGGSVTFTATLTGSSPAPTGTLAFKDGGATISGCGAIPIAGSEAACTTPSLLIGTRSITAEYSGSADYNVATSNTVSQAVKPLAPAITAPSAAATVAPNPTIAGTGTNGASVTVREGISTVCTATVSGSGAWSCASSLGAGSHTIAATQELSAQASAASPSVTFSVLPSYLLSVTKSGAGTGTVTADAGGLSCGSTCSVSYTHGTLVALTATPAAGSAFAGWSGACSGTGGCNVPMDSAKSVVATFAVAAYTVTPSAGPGGSISPPTAQPVNHGGTVSFTVTPNAGYTASVGGTCGGNLVGTTYTTNAVTLDCTVAATFAVAGYTLTVNKSGTGSGTVFAVPSGISCGATCSASYAAHASVTLIATSNAGTSIEGWTGCDSVSSNKRECTVTMESARTVSPIFTAHLVYNVVLEGRQMVNPYVAITQASGGGTVTFDPVSRFVRFDLAVTGLLNGYNYAEIRGPAARGAVGPHIAALNTLGSPQITGFPPEIEAQLVAGQLYVVVYSNGFGNQQGELRGQIDNLGAAPAHLLTVTKNGLGTVTGKVETFQTVIDCGADCSELVPVGKGVTLMAAAGPGHVFTGWGGACAGTGECTVTMDAAKSVTAAFDASSDPPRLGNISTRMQVLTGNDVLIGGFVIGGVTNKRVAIVATGPSLVPFGITNALPNPTLRLVRSSDQAVLATSDDWQTAANQVDLIAAGLAPSNALEAAILIDLAPGAYTAIVEGAGGVTGVSVIGVYEVNHPEAPLVNISTRGRVLTGNDVMIGGFVISGAASQTLAIVATGPSLAAFGITSPLPNPKITLVRSSDQVVVASNDDWPTDANSSQLQAAGFAPSNQLESGLYRTLAPGAYTVIVEGVGGGTGVAVIGVYKVN